MSSTTPQSVNVHQAQPVVQAGEPLDSARAAMVLLHGRGASAHDIIELAREVYQPGFIYLAPQAAEHTWYPNRFLAPLSSNEPWLSSALSVISTLLEKTHKSGIPLEKTVLLGFSQGACLALEYAARNARRYGGVIGLSGGLIGPEVHSRSDPGSLEGSPVFLGCSDPDPHIPRARVEETASYLERLGAQVTLRFYPEMGHTVNEDELEIVRGILRGV